jgi:elongator complex protein 3
MSDVVQCVGPQVSAILRTYDQLITRGILANNLALRSLLVRKSVRSWSGVLVVTIFTSPGQFSCPRDCYYCPNEVDENGTSTQPRSYLSTEPGCRRALANDFDCVRQFRDRVGCLKSIGHKVDKIEVKRGLAFRV